MTRLAARCLSRRPARGFTLIEIMIAVGLVALLVGLAVPAYQAQTRKSRRADAKAALLDLAARQERYFSINNSYTSTAANLGLAGSFPQNVMSGSTAYYTMTVTSASATAYVLTAAPTSGQSADPCGSFTLDQLGNQGNSGNSQASNTCW